MNKPDARALSEESLELLRRQAKRLRADGRTWSDIALLIGVHLTTVMKWSRRFDMRGSGTSESADEMKSQRRGRRFGENRTISLVDETLLRDEILGSNPKQMSLPFALWNRKAVQEAIKLRFGVDMPIRTVGEYLRRWGFTPQRPIKRAVEQRPELLQTWLDESYPAIMKRAKAEGGEIYWADETAIKQDTAWVRGYAPAGQTPVIVHAARWTSITMISAVTNKGLVRFAFHDGAINAERFVEFLEALIEDAERKVFLIVDNLRVHHSKLVKAWLAERKEQMEIFYLPPYSPEANPDEILNRDLKTELRTRPAAPDAQALKKIANDFMEKLMSMPGRVIRYFKSRSIAYAACM
jgi:transposase